MNATDPSIDPALIPWDEHARAFQAQLHPPHWANPAPKPLYDMVVIGGGPAGLVCAGGAALLGARVALIEKRFLGGDCTVAGCVPSKALLHAATTHQCRVPDAEPYRRERFADAMDEVRRIRAHIAHDDSAERFTNMGCDVFFGEASFMDDSRVQVGETTLCFKRACVATGASPATPPIPGLAETPHHTNETIFSLTEPPASLAIIGAGPIGCELGQAFARLGVEVTILDRDDRILPKDDLDAAKMAQEQLQADGVRFELGVDIDRVDRAEAGVVMRISRQGQESAIPAEQLLVAAGRSPNTAGLNLEAAGVQATKRGVTVNRYLRTTSKRIYAAGDVCSAYKFTHAADAMARIVIRNALFWGWQRVDRLIIPWCTYTTPEVGHIGMPLDEAANRPGAVLKRFDLNATDRGKTDNARGFIKLVYLAHSGKILAATVAGDHAGELLGELSVAMNSGGLRAIAGAVHAYPTLAEALRKIADGWQIQKLESGWMRWLAGLVLKLQR